MTQNINNNLNFLSWFSSTPSQQNQKQVPRPVLSYHNLNWKERTVANLNDLDICLDNHIPNWLLQTKIDELGAYIQDTFSCLTDFNTWLRDNGNSNWFMQLATALVKLPMRVAHNIINLVYTLVKETLYLGLHPLKGLNSLAKLIVSLAHALTQPETWSKIGAGMIGGGLAHSVMFANPLPLITVAIGAGLMIAGISFGALKAAIYAEEGHSFKAATENFGSQLLQIPESALTGFCVGLIVAGIKKAWGTSTIITNPSDVHSLQEAKSYADYFIQKNHLPPYSSVSYDSAGNFTIEWGNQFQNFIDKFPMDFASYEAMRTYLIAHPDFFAEYIPLDPNTPYGAWVQVPIDSAKVVFSTSSAPTIIGTWPDERLSQHINQIGLQS